MIYPEELRTKKSRVAYFIFKQLYAFNQGKGNVIGQFTGPLPEIMAMLYLLEQFGFILSKIQIICLALLTVMGCWFIGKLYMRMNLDKIQNIATHERNPLLNDLQNKRKREKL